MSRVFKDVCACVFSTVLGLFYWVAVGAYSFGILLSFGPFSYFVIIMT